MIYAWGANSYGQLGLGHVEDCLVPQSCNVFSATERNVVQIDGGGGHTSYLTEGGDVFMCGSNHKGELGLADVPTQTPTMIACPSLEHIKAVACGWSHTVACTGKDCGIFASGSNTFGQLGLSLTGKTSTFQFVQTDDTVVGVAAGMNHTLAVTATGDVWATGCSRKGQLGNSGDVNKYETHLVKVDFGPRKGRVSKVAAGGNHSMALTEDGRVFCWGVNSHGQCALPSAKSSHKEGRVSSSCTSHVSVECVYVPVQVPLATHVVDIACGWSHSYALTSDGGLLGWGRGDYGQLGRSLGDSSCSHLPRLVPFPDGCRVGVVRCGAEHTLALTDDGSVVAWGWNEHGMCGTGNEDNVMHPAIVQGIDTGHRGTLIGCGAGTSFVLCR